LWRQWNFRLAGGEEVHGRGGATEDRDMRGRASGVGVTGKTGAGYDGVGMVAAMRCRRESEDWMECAMVERAYRNVEWVEAGKWVGKR
jgi:hypothetical protein